MMKALKPLPLNVIQRDLLAAGMCVAVPLTVIQNATRNDQRSIVTTLNNLAADIQDAGIGSPAIMVVGETVRYALRASLVEEAASSEIVCPHQESASETPSFCPC